MKDLIRKIIKETVENGEVICDECGWSWDMSEGGDDMYICHKCGHDNTPKSQSNLSLVINTKKGRINLPLIIVLFSQP